MDEANEAYERGDYEAAYREWLPLAEQGDAVAQFKLGVMYMNGHVYSHGEGVSQDYAEAVKWYHKAAEQGEADSQNSLGFMYFEGQGLPQDYNQAIKWYRAAAEQGHAIAQANMAFMYVNGQGVSRDLVEAYMWLSLAAAQGDDHAFSVLDNLGAELTPWAKLKAKRRARQWMEKHGKAE